MEVSVAFAENKNNRNTDEIRNFIIRKIKELLL